MLYMPEKNLKSLKIHSLWVLANPNMGSDRVHRANDDFFY